MSKHKLLNYSAHSPVLFRLDIGYIDLYLIHTPRPGKNIDSYKAMLKLKDEGVLRWSHKDIEATISSLYLRAWTHHKKHGMIWNEMPGTCCVFKQFKVEAIWTIFGAQSELFVTKVWMKRCLILGRINILAINCWGYVHLIQIFNGKTCIV